MELFNFERSLEIFIFWHVDTNGLAFLVTNYGKTVFLNVRPAPSCQGGPLLDLGHGDHLYVSTTVVSSPFLPPLKAPSIPGLRQGTIIVQTVETRDHYRTMDDLVIYFLFAVTLYWCRFCLTESLACTHWTFLEVLLPDGLYHNKEKYSKTCICMCQPH